MRYPLALGVIGISLFPFAATAEASLRLVTKAKTPVAEIEANLSVLKTDRRLLDEISARLVLPESWKLDDDETAKRLAEKLSIALLPGQGSTAALQATDDDPTQAAILANTAASVLRDHFEGSKMEPEEFKTTVAEQEAAVADKRKLLAQIIRTEGIIYSGEKMPAEPNPEDKAKAGAAAQGFVDAKKDFEAAQQKLEDLKNGNVPRKGFSIDHIRWAKTSVE